VTSEAYERIAGELVGTLSQQMPVEAIYLDLHGAMVSEDFEDGEGEILRRVRAVVGEEIPVVVSLDYHANVTPAMVRCCDGMAAFLTYPHVDRKETGLRAASILSTILTRGRPRGRALCKIPFLIPLNFQCTLIEPSKSVVERSASGEGGEVLSLSYLAGFPPADLFDCGPAVVAYAYSQETADAAADGLAREIVLREPEFAQPLLSPEAGVKKAVAIAKRSKRPVIIADTQDNPGCGGTSDTTGVLKALVERDAQGAVLAVMCDANAAAEAHAAGEGSEITIDLGGKHAVPGVEPFRGTFRVKRLGNGKFKATGPTWGGRDIDLGPMALLAIGGVNIVVASRRMQANDQQIFRHLGVEPKDQKILVLKSSVHFRADFEPIAEEILVVLAPGGHILDPARFPYKHLRPGVRLSPLGPEFVPPDG
jgi:microcystin degradation protein MlrC